MVTAEEKLMLLLTKSQQRQSQQRRLVQYEALIPVSLDERLKLSFTLSVCQSAPVVFRHGEIDLPVNGLHGSLKIFPEKTGAQDRVSLYDPFPRLLEHGDVQFALNRE